MIMSFYIGEIWTLWYNKMINTVMLQKGTHVVRKALRYILILIIVGVLIIAGGLGAIYLVPNTFAQDDGTQVLVIEKGQTGTEIADMLYERGLIRSTQGFKLWLYLSGTNDKLQTGHYQIPNKVTVRELISLLQEGHVESIRVTIPEGYTVGDIATRS